MKIKILLYVGDATHKQAIVERVLQDMNISYRMLDDRDLNEKTGYLFGLD